MSRGRPAARRIAAIAAAAVLGGSALLGCSTNGSGGGDLTPASTTDADGGTVPADLDVDGGVEVETGPAPTGDPDRFAVWDAYVGFWREDASVLEDPTRPLDDLRTLLVEPQLSRTTEFLTGQREQGLRSVGTIRLTPEVDSLGEDEARVADCLDDTDLWSVDADDVVLPDSRGSRQPVLVTLLPAADGSGAWRVSDLAQGAPDSCPEATP